MTNYKLIKEVVKTVSFLYEAKRITETNNSIEKRVLNWYNHTDIADFEMLVAAAWIGDYNLNITYDIIETVRDMLFSPSPLEGLTNYHIGEIEEALHDEKWR